MSAHAWKLIRTGAADGGLRELQAAYLEKPGASRAIEYGAALLWIHKYHDAWEHFHEARRHRRWTADIYFGMAGVAKWCLDDTEEAVAEWTAGLKAQYADGAGGARMPLLLYFASIVKPGSFAHTEAIDLLTMRANDARIKNWPGPIVEFLLERLDETALRKKCAGMDADDTYLNHWFVDFYVGVRARARGDLAHFKEAMRRTATTSDDDFDVSHRLRYLSKLWHHEFFLACHEADRAPVATRTTRSDG